MPITNLNEVENPTSKPAIPSGAYTLVCVKVEKKDSQAGNPMLVLEHEIVQPEAVMIDDKPVRIAGLKVSDFITLNKSGGLAKLRQIHQFNDLPMAIDTDEPGFENIYLGCAVKARLSCDSKPVIDENTNAPILDESGNPVNTVRYNVMQLLASAKDARRTVQASSEPSY